MSTISSEVIIETMLRNGGVYPGDPPVFAILEYKNQFNGDVAWKLCRRDSDVDNFLVRGAYQGVPVFLIVRGQLTGAGKDWLEDRGKQS
jgi:hypothetical protein